MPAHPIPPLTAVEARILGVLVEKERTVPDTYPLTLNALVAGCNQKSSRDPVMDVGDSDVLNALDRLRQLSLVIESSGGRAMRYSQNVRRVLDVPSESVALLATLALRGPQTAAELRANAERLYRFSDISALEAFLDELRSRSAGALVVELPRQPGAREHRWMHLLCGMPEGALAGDGDAPAAGGSFAGGSADSHGSASLATAVPVGHANAGARAPAPVAALEAEVRRLEAEVAALRSELAAVADRLDRLCRQLGSE